MITHQASGRVIASQIVKMDTAKKRSRGLLSYSKPSESLAALFFLPFFGVFPLVHTFGMSFPIDIVYCNSQKQICAIFRRVPPNRLVMPWKALFGGCPYLLEFVDCDLSEVKKGDQLEWMDH